MRSRYNPEGEWRPFVQGGDEAAARSLAIELAQDRDLLGPLFYVFYTGFEVLEFVVRAAFALPQERMSLGDGRVNLYRCPPFHSLQNTIVYDGWAPLQAPDADELRSLLRVVDQTVNRLAFAYQASVTWRPKYMDFTTRRGYATPDKSDLPRLDQFLTFEGSERALSLLDAAIDWHNRSRSSSNILNEFLGYYVSMEAMAVAIDKSPADFGLAIQTETRSERRAGSVVCIERLFEELYASRPIQFVNDAYSQCVNRSLRYRLETAANAVLGPDRAREIFEPHAGDSLSNIRNRIAHGKLALTNPDDEGLVRECTPRMAKISREFLIRLLLRVPAGEPLPTWSGRHRVGISLTDPRGAGLVPPEHITAHDWRLRPEWCD